MRIPVVALVAGLAVSLLGCKGPAADDPCAAESDPVASLVCPAPSAVFGEEYWYQEAAAGSEVWRRALAFCSAEGHGLLARCLEVRRTELFLALERETAESRALREKGEPVLPDPTDDAGGISPLPFAPPPPPSASDFGSAAPAEEPGEDPDGGRR